MTDLKTQEQEISFIVGEVFRHAEKTEEGIKTWIIDPFAGEIWKPASELRVIFDLNSLVKRVNEYHLPKEQDDVVTEKETGLIDWNQNDFWALAYLLTIKPTLGSKLLGFDVRSKKYLLYVKIGDRRYQMHIQNSWCYCHHMYHEPFNSPDTDLFGDYARNRKGYIVLYQK